MRQRIAVPEVPIGPADAGSGHTHQRVVGANLEDFDIPQDHGLLEIIPLQCAHFFMGC